MSWTEIAVDMARLIALQHGGKLESFSLDGVDVEDKDGVEVIHVQASATISPLADEVPWEDEAPFEVSTIDSDEAAVG